MQPSSLISLEMASIQSEHPDFAMFRNCINQPFGAYDFFEIMHVLDYHSNHYFLKPWRNKVLKEGFKTRKASKASNILLNEKHAEMSTLNSDGWGLKKLLI